MEVEYFLLHYSMICALHHLPRNDFSHFIPPRRRCRRRRRYYFGSEEEIGVTDFETFFRFLLSDENKYFSRSSSGPSPCPARPHPFYIRRHAPF